VAFFNRNRQQYILKLKRLAVICVQVIPEMALHLLR
jgi:hypothetical protein